MRRRGLVFLALLASSGAVMGACSSHDSTRGPAAGAGDSTVASESATQSTSSADVIDVRSGSKMTLALRGGLGPIISGQSLTKAAVSMSDLELVDASGASVSLATGPFTGDLIALQDQLGPIFSQQSVQAGQYTALRFRLGGAAIEAQDAQGAATVYASQGFDTSQFSDVTSVQTLQLAGLDSGGFVTCALPPGGLVVDGASSLALQFAFAQSLVVQSDGSWVLTPRCFLIDQSAFSSLDVDFQIASGIQESFESGFQVMLLDSNLYPVCQVPLAVYQSTTFRAQFVYIASFEGPFVAALVPPSGFSLQSSVAFSVDVQQSASCSASISVTSFDVVSGRSFAIGTDNQCRVVQRDPHGQVLAQTSEPIGAVEDVAPTMHHRQPVAPGEQPPAPAQVPQIPGNPPPRMGHGHGMMPPTMPSSTSSGHPMMPPTMPSGSTEPSMMPPAPPATSTGHGKMPPAPTPTSTGQGKMPPGPGTTPPSTPPPATTGTSGPPTPSGTATAPPAPKGRGGPPPSPGGPTPPVGGPPPSSGSPSAGGPSPSGGGRGPKGGPPATSGNPHAGGGGDGRHGR